MPDRRSTSTVRATLADGIAYVAKAHEYLEAAEDALARGNHIATVGNAVHATIAIRAASQAVAAADRVDLEAMHVAGSLDVSAVADVLTRFLGADDDRIERLHSLERI